MVAAPLISPCPSPVLDECTPFSAATILATVFPLHTVLPSGFTIPCGICITKSNKEASQHLLFPHFPVCFHDEGVKNNSQNMADMFYDKSNRWNSHTSSSYPPPASFPGEPLQCNLLVNTVLHILRSPHVPQASGSFISMIFLAQSKKQHHRLTVA